MKLSVCIDAVFHNQDFYEAIEKVCALGYDTVEFWAWWDKDIEKLIMLKENYNLTYSAFCTKFFSLTDESEHLKYIEGLRESIEIAKKLGCKQLITQTGNDTGESRKIQRASLVKGLKACVPYLEANDMTLLVEPLNIKVDHKGYYLYSSQEAFEIIDEVGSPHVKVLFDIYHQQITEGDVSRNIEMHLGKIGHFHAAGNPGRHELDKGEINYTYILEKLIAMRFEGNVGLEYFPLDDVEKGLRTLNHYNLGGDKDFQILYEEAKSKINPKKLSEDADSGGVGAALLTQSGNIYTGVCIDTACSMGFCAEHAAAATMIANGEHHVTKIIAVDWDGKILPPCGRCREFLSQLHPDNIDAEVKVDENTVLRLKELLPFDWKQKNKQ